MDGHPLPSGPKGPHGPAHARMTQGTPHAVGFAAPAKLYHMALRRANGPGGGAPGVRPPTESDSAQSPIPRALSLPSGG